MRPMAELIDAVKAHAVEHYNEGGWDYVVESFERDELADILREAKAGTVAAAIAAVGEVVKLLEERRREVHATIW